LANKGEISPCLANATLNGLELLLEDHLKKRFGTIEAKKTKVQVVRYADDFVILANSKELLENEIKPWIEQFLFVRGVALSQEKTRIAHIHQGFDFLGWNFRKYVPKSPHRKTNLLIKPAKKNISTFYRKVRDFIKNSGTLNHTQGALMGRLNPVLRGWAQYHFPVVAKATFNKLDNLIFWRILRWAKRRHPRKSVGWLKRRYYCSGIHRAFVYPVKGGDGTVKFRQLYMLADTVIVRQKRLPGA
jgi:RNA-directed DNA polymerase